MENYGYVKKINDNHFIVKAELDTYGSGYGVVPKDEDEFNMYDIDEVRAYVDEHPEMLFEHYNNEPDFLNAEIVAKLSELAELETWFADVYDIQVKQYERCTRLGIEYDNKHGTMDELDAQAQKNAERIRALRESSKREG